MTAGGHGAFAVIGQQDAAGFPGRMAHGRHQTRLGVLAGRAGILGVDAQQLLSGRDVAGLHSRRPAALGDQMPFHAGFGADQSERLVGGRVVADHAGQRRQTAEGCNVTRHIAGAAEHGGLAAARQHRHGRLGRGAVDLAIDEAIDHHVADAGHAHAGDGGQQ